MKKILILALLALASAAHADGPPMAYGYLYPDGSLPRAEWSPAPLAPKPGAEVVEIDAEAPPAGMMAMPPDMPVTYDPATRHAIPWQAEIDRRAADAAAVEQDRTRLAAAVAQAIQALDQVDADVAALAAAPDASLDTVAKLRAALRTLGRDIGRLAAIHRRIVRWAGRQAGAVIPAEP